MQHISHLHGEVGPICLVPNPFRIVVDPQAPPGDIKHELYKLRTVCDLSESKRRIFHFGIKRFTEEKSIVQWNIVLIDRLRDTTWAERKPNQTTRYSGWHRLRRAIQIKVSKLHFCTMNILNVHWKTRNPQSFPLLIVKLPIHESHGTVILARMTLFTNP